MDRLSPQKKTTRVRKTSSVSRGFWAQKATREARNAIDAFENLLREKSKQQIVGVGVAIAITLIIFFYSLYIGNYLIALIVIAVWVATWKRPRHHNLLEVGKQRDFDQKRKKHSRHFTIKYRGWLELRWIRHRELSVKIMTGGIWSRQMEDSLPPNYKMMDLQI